MNNGFITHLNQSQGNFFMTWSTQLSFLDPRLPSRAVTQAHPLTPFVQEQEESDTGEDGRKDGAAA